MFIIALTIEHTESKTVFIFPLGFHSNTLSSPRRSLTIPRQSLGIIHSGLFHFFHTLSFPPSKHMSLAYLSVPDPLQRLHALAPSFSSTTELTSNITTELPLITTIPMRTFSPFAFSSTASSRTTLRKTLREHKCQRNSV